MKDKFYVNPKYLLWLTITFGTFLILFTIFDIYQNQKDIYKSKSEEAVTLLRVVQKSAENVFLSSMEVENLIINKLIDNASFVSRLENQKSLNEIQLNRLSEENDIEHFYMFSNNELEFRNTNSEYSELHIFENFQDEIDSILLNKFDYYIAGSTFDIDGNNHLLVLHKREADSKGIIAVSVESNYLLDFRKKIGIGKLLQRIADDNEIEYLLIQDHEGIIVASEGVTQFSSIEADAFLQNSINTKTIQTRKFSYNNNEIFEAVKPFSLDNEIIGIIRIGFSLDLVNSLINRAVVRSVVISLLFFLIGIVLIIFTANSKSLSLLKKEHRKIQTYNSKILENMSDAIIVTDHAGKIKIFNKAAESIFNIESSNIIDKHYDFLIKNSSNLIKESYEKKNAVRFWEDFVQLKNQKTKILNGATAIILNSENKIDSIIAVIRDVTEQKNNDEINKRREKLTSMGELAASVAHEIKNPLNAISISFQRFEKEFVPNSDSEEYFSLVRNAKSEILRVSKIIDQFLKFARPQKINLQKVNFKKILEEIFILFKSEAINRRIDFTYSSEDHDVRIDKEQIKQSLINIVQNSFDAVKDGGKITLETKVDNEHLIIEISDNGSGIEKTDIEKIFNLYYSKKHNGSGLGLSIVNQIISEHNGKIYVQSTPNEKTIFKIEIPVK